VSQLELEMKVQVVAESTTVTASSDPVDAKESSGTNAIGESAVVHMPNRDEHFENLLPLVPGVISGSFKPRSIFQSISRTELRGQESH
jgi:hypothetical protein